jgi:putative membrane protein
MKQLACIAFILTVFVTLHACNENRKARNFNNTVDAEAQNFITKGIEGGNAEIQLSHLALKASKSKAITDFANMMIAEHTEAGNELKR